MKILTIIAIIFVSLIMLLGIIGIIACFILSGSISEQERINALDKESNKEEVK